MINEVLNEIALAEEEAKEIILKAEEEAKSISLSSIAEIEKLKEEMALETKNIVKAKLDAANEEADRETALIDKDAKEAASSAIKRGEKNSLKAIETIADFIINNI